MKLKQEIIKIAQGARKASTQLANLPASVKNKALLAMAKALVSGGKSIISANKKDAEIARSRGASKAFIDRLIVDRKKLNAMAQCLKELARLPEPVGEAISQWSRPSGILIKKVRVPLGVLLIIYESRPDVTSDCMGLCLKSGNAVILRGGKEALRT
ncbi:MAG: gamma-glutamyl-phosphate reductase, partial [Candidatus Omnitrophota bacterium]